MEIAEEKRFDVSVIAPVFNEAESITPLCNAVREVLDAQGLVWELILVNDGSVDQSGSILDEVATGDKRVKIINFRRNYGQTAAMMAGIDFASGDIIVAIDADLQNDPADIPKLLMKLEEGFDVC